MSHIEPTTIIDTIGFTIGVIGVSAVVFLLMVSKNQHNARRLSVILVVSTSLVLMNVEPWFGYNIASLTVRLFSYVGLLGLIVWESYQIWLEGIETPTAEELLPNGE